MLTATQQYRDALPYPHRRVTRVQVYQGGVLVGDSDTNPTLLPVSGAVSASLTSRVTRTLSMVVQPELFPVTPTDLMSPYASVLKISSGIGYPDGSRELFPIFTGRVTDVPRAGDGGVHITGDDLAFDVVGFQFEQPQASMAGSPIPSEIRRLILQALPSAVFGTDDVPDGETPILVWDTDRGQALDDLAQAVQGRWYAQGDGSFVNRKYPYTTGTPVATLVDQSGGLVITADRSITRIGTANSVTVVSERMDGTDPVRVTVRDNNPLSPTFFGGPYGRVSKVINVQTPLSQAAAQQLAIAELEASTALVEQWGLSIVPDHTLEPGDPIGVSYRQVSSVQVIDRMTYPLGLQNMTLGTRASVSPIVTG
jgi:hypothetical protein